MNIPEEMLESIRCEIEAATGSPARLYPKCHTCGCRSNHNEWSWVGVWAWVCGSCYATYRKSMQS